MCTIHTYSAKFYRKNQKDINIQIIRDAITNEDGLSMVFLDGHNAVTNTVYRTMSAENLTVVLSMLMADATKYARVFIHLRAATTTHVGVGFTHAFDDMQGIFYMHNGVITNTGNMAVDSFNMANWADTRGSGMLVNLLGRKEHFANVFRIDTVGYKWSMTRMSSGTLHTDGHGNYSSRAFGPITEAVEHHSTQSYTLSFLPKPLYNNYYSGGIHRTGTGSASGFGSGFASGTQRPDSYYSGTNTHRPDAYYGDTYRGDWKDGKRWDWEAKGYVSEADWERSRKVRSDKWTSMYEEDDVGYSGESNDKTLPPFVPGHSAKDKQDSVDSVMRVIAGKAGLAAARTLLDDGDIPDPIDMEVNLDSGEGQDGSRQSSSRELTPEEIADQDYLDALEAEYGYAFGYEGEFGGDYSVGADGIVEDKKEMIPVILGPDAPACSVPSVKHEPDLPLSKKSGEILEPSYSGTPNDSAKRQVVEPNYDEPKYQRWLLMRTNSNKRGA